MGRGCAINAAGVAAIVAMLLVLLVSVAPAQSPDAEVAWATFRQEVLPSWAQRAEIGDRKLEAREGWLSDENSFAVAFPDLVGARLDRPEVVRGRRLALAAVASKREVERQEPLPDLGSEENLATAVAAREKALASEEAADAVLARFLTGVDAHLQRHPELNEAGLNALRSPLLAVIEASRLPPVDAAAQAQAEARAAAADEELAALDRLQARLRDHAVTGAALPDFAETCAALDQAAHAEAVAARLNLARPFLRGDALVAVDAALAGYYGGPALEAARARREEATAALAQVSASSGDDEAELFAALEREEERLAELEVALSAMGEEAPERGVMAVHIETQVAVVGAAHRRLELVQSGGQADLGAATADAERARQQAESAAASAKDDSQRARAAFLAQAADASERRQALAQRLETRKIAKFQSEKELEEKIAELEVGLGLIRDSSPIPGSGPNADDAYAVVRGLRLGLMDGEVARGIGVQTAVEGVAEVRARGVEDRLRLNAGNTLDGPGIRAAKQAWRDALDNEAAIADELLTAAYAERETVLTSLQHLNEIRREMRGYVTWRQVDIDNSSLSADIGRELLLLGPTVSSRAAFRVGELLSFPRRLFRDPTLIVGLLGGLFWTVVLLGGWSWARGKSEVLASRLTIQLRRFRPSLKPIDLHRLKGPTADAVKAIIDLTLGQLMVWLISPLSPEIAFLVKAWLLLAIYRALLALFDLAVVKAPDFRLSVVALAATSHELVRFSARVLIIWVIARGFTYYVLWGMLQLDSLTDFVMTLFNLVGLGLAVWLLYRWDPMLRERVRARNQDSRLVAFFSRELPWRVLRPVAAFAMLVFFAVSMSVDFLYFLIARDRTGLARLFNVISRFQMSGDENQPDGRLDDAVIADLCSRQPGHKVYVKRPEYDEAFDKAFENWRETGRRGMMALVGDRGEGKRTEFERIAVKAERFDLPVVRARLQHVEINERVLLDWVADLVDLPAGLHPDVLIERLGEMDRRVFLLGQMHRTFSRSVGGFQGISTLLYVLNGSSDRHLWVLGMHRPAWQYLASIPSLVDVGVFESVLRLEPFDSGMLRELTLNRCGANKLSVDFRTLMRANLLGADPEVELERSVNAFYRLLAEASDGNPRVAMHLFSSCLEAGEQPNTARVHVRRALGTEVASEVGIDGLFTLVALRQQDAMSLREIVDVTNLPEHRIRNTVRNLQSRELVAFEGGHLYIPIQRLPMVSRTLRRRHLLYLGS